MAKAESKFGVVAEYLGAGDLPPAWVRACAPTLFASQLEQLTRLLGHAEYDPEHRCLIIRRADLTRLVLGQLFEIEIYLAPGQQPRLYRGYVREVTATGAATFRGSRLMPLPKAELRRAIRDATRTPRWTAIYHVTQPGELAQDLGLIDRYQRTFSLLHAYDEGRLPDQTAVADALAKLLTKGSPNAD